MDKAKTALVAITLSGVTLALIFSGVGASLVTTSSDQGDGSLTYARTVESRSSLPSATGSPTDVLSAIVAATDSPRIIDASIGPAPADFLENGYRGLWVFLVVDAPSVEGPAAIRAVWDAVLIAGAFRDEMYSAGLTPPEGYGVSVRLPDGTTDHYAAWPFADVALGQRFTPQQQRGAAEAEIRASLAEAGFTRILVDFPAPRDLAAAVILEAADPSSIATRSDLDHIVEAAFRDPRDYEGIYVEVDKPSGKPLYVLARSFRTGDGLSYTAPSLEIEPLRGPINQP